MILTEPAGREPAISRIGNCGQLPGGILQSAVSITIREDAVSYFQGH